MCVLFLPGFCGPFAFGDRVGTPLDFDNQFIDMRKLLASMYCLFGLAGTLFGQKPGTVIHPTQEVLNYADTVHHVEKMAEFGMVLGMSRCNGDIANDGSFAFDHNLSPTAGIFFRRTLSPFLAWRGIISVGRLEDGDDFYTTPEWRSGRHFSYETFTAGANLRLEWDILGKRRYRKGVDTTVYSLDKHTQYALVNHYRRGISPFVFVGGGALGSQAKVNFNYDTEELGGLAPAVALDQDKSAGFQINPSVLAGAGLHFDLGPRFVLGAEISTQLPFNDYLDGISEAGNPEKPDWMWFGGITLGFRLATNDRDRDGTPDKKDKCPDIPGPNMTNGCPDIDHDGVADREDDCPHKKGIRALAGCPVKDADEDGVPDVDDQCLTVPGLPQFQGCPDTDGDGVEDRLDSCKTVAGIAQFNGCPDTDGDGIEDKLDACPNEKGPAEYYYGCPVRDTDGDGIEDKLDACLLVKGIAEFKGCPDSDGDGVEDKLDPCPNTPGPKDNRGCPIVEKKDREKLELAVKAVKFETGKAVLKTESNKILGDIADILKRYPYYNLRIEGHTDSQGKDEANKILSEKRAQACADFLTAKAVAKERLKVKGFGETQPVADNKTATGRAQNRRVEFELELPSL
jgi:outer membrane protein OmpA-like peptidoglycan-associated protein